MKASELIGDLTQMIMTHGDLPVSVGVDWMKDMEDYSETGDCAGVKFHHLDRAGCVSRRRSRYPRLVIVAEN